MRYSRALAGLVGLLLVMLAPAARAQVCTALPYTLLNGTIADAGQVMSNFNTLENCFNVLLNGGATPNQIFLAQTNAPPALSTATYPSTTVVNQLLWSSANNTIGGLTTCNSGVIKTGVSGIPSCNSTLPNMVQLNITMIGTLATDAITSYAATAAATQHEVVNSGDNTNAATVAKVSTVLSGCTNCFGLMQVAGGANPSVSFSSGSGATGGLAITSGAGNVAITTAAALTIAGITNTQETDILCYNNSTLVVTYAVNVAGCVASAMRLKNRKAWLGADAAQGLMALRPVVFTYKDPQQYGAGTFVGLYADDVCAMDERLCVRDKSGLVESYDKVGLTAYLVAAVQRQQREIERLEHR